MKKFQDAQGNIWVATVRERPGTDYKGRFYFAVRPEDAGEEKTIALEDIRWNSRKTAERTLNTMSGVELRRRLRSALGRSGIPPVRVE